MEADEGAGSDREVDLLVIGAGAAGMATALVAASLGLEILLCEKTRQVGGTTATSAGTVWIPGSEQSRRAQLVDTVEDARRYLDAIIGNARDDSREAFLATGPAALDYLETHSAVKFQPVPRHPDYQSNRPGAAIGGRALASMPFDGRLLGDDFDLVRPPIAEFMVLGGMMVGKDDIAPLVHPFASLRAFRRAVALLARHASDRLRHRRGTRLVMGNALVARLLYSLRQHRVPIWLDASAEALVREAGRVVGARFAVAGRSCVVRARRGVVLASGGFAGDPALIGSRVEATLPRDPVAFAGAAGDGMRLAERAGAAIDEAHATPAFWSPISTMTRNDGTVAVFPHLLLDRAKPGLIAVNATGRRFVNEGDSYHDFVLGMLRAPGGVPAWLVCDRAFIAKYGLGLVHPGTRRLNRFVARGYLVTAPTIAELAALLGVDRAGLEKSVADNNRFAATGTDEEFGKGTSELNRHNGDPTHRPNPCLGPIATPPFFALRVEPGAIGSSIGLATDRDGRVLDAEGGAIAGLYACGNDMASVMRGHYPGPGITLGPALAFAYRVAMHAAGKALPRPSQVESAAAQ
jgi:succinate dehydrogenase/fumarate reductase flavoprotein subunit